MRALSGAAVLADNILRSARTQSLSDQSLMISLCSIGSPTFSRPFPGLSPLGPVGGRANIEKSYYRRPQTFTISKLIIDDRGI